MLAQCIEVNYLELAITSITFNLLGFACYVVEIKRRTRG